MLRNSGGRGDSGRVDNIHSCDDVIPSTIFSDLNPDSPSSTSNDHSNQSINQLNHQNVPLRTSLLPFYPFHHQTN
jgi:hypothetical protein